MGVYLLAPALAPAVLDDPVVLKEWVRAGGGACAAALFWFCFGLFLVALVVGLYLGAFSAIAHNCDAVVEAGGGAEQGVGDTAQVELHGTSVDGERQLPVCLSVSCVAGE